MGDVINISQYDAKDWSLMVNGVYMTGLGEDMFSISKSEDFFTSSVGGKGDVVKNVINNNTGEGEINLQPTSPQFAMCIDLANQRATFPIWAINKTLGIRVGGTSASFTNYPEITASSEAEDQAFTIAIDDYAIENI